MHHVAATKKIANLTKAPKPGQIAKTNPKRMSTLASRVLSTKLATGKNAATIAAKSLSKAAPVTAKPLSKSKTIHTMIEFAAKYGFSNAVLAEILDVTTKTLSRYQANDKPLSTQQKDRIEMVESILALGVRVLGDEGEMKNWLSRPVYSIDNKRPIDLIVSESGRRRVENVLLQIEGGAY